MNWLNKIITAILILLLLGVIFLFALEIFNTGKIAWGVQIDSLDIGHQTKNQAEKTLSEKITSFNKATLTFEKNNRTWRNKIEETGVQFNISETINQAYQIGRQKNPFQNIFAQIKALLGFYKIPTQVSFNEAKYQSFHQDNFSEIEDPVQETSLTYNKERDIFEIRPGQAGNIVKPEILKNKIKQRVQNFQNTIIEIDLNYQEPQVTVEKAKETARQALAIIKQSPFKLNYQDNDWPVKKELLLDWLIFEPEGNDLEVSLSSDEVMSFLAGLAPEINKPAVNAQLKTENNQVKIASPAQDETEIDSQNTFEKIKENILLKNKKETLVQVKYIPAPVRKETLHSLGLTDFLGQGHSNFSGSSANRVHNIKVGSAQFDGRLIKPDEEFSFNENVGEISAATGYLPEMVIKNKKTVPEYGGGLCQVSTTLFRAAINTGLKITERYAHAFPVSYYNPQGFDATVYPPHPDLRFKNNTSNHLLIQRHIEGNSLYFEMFGSNDNRQVKVEGPYIYERGEDGAMKTVLTQKVYRQDELIFEDKFYSNYKSPSLYPVDQNPLE